MVHNLPYIALKKAKRLQFTLRSQNCMMVIYVLLMMMVILLIRAILNLLLKIHVLLFSPRILSWLLCLQ